MPIVMSRKGEILQVPVLSKEQKDRAWEVLTNGWAKANQDVLRQLKEEMSAPQAAS